MSPVSIPRDGTSRPATGRLLGLLFLAILLQGLSACTGKITGPPADESASPPNTPTTGGDGGTSGPSPCPTGQALCAEECVDLQTDPTHCGGCDLECPGGMFCESGECQRICPVGDIVCDGECVAAASDLDNCGQCGVSCAVGDFCSSGSCTSTCSLTECDTESGTECVDPQTSARHCGGCNFACAPGQSCVDGSCTVVCPEGRTECNGACVVTDTNVDHCGGCGVECPTGEPCLGGACGCPDGQAVCGGSCVDIVSNPANCGACGVVCSGGASCVNSACVCPAGTQQCSDGCRDTTSDIANCGGCGIACDADEICDQSSCRPATTGCSSGLTLCGASCVNTQTSSAHCGGCDAACPTAQSCSNGTCSCPSGGTLCGDSCVDTQTSNAHCGGCNAQCTNGRSCVSGNCECPDGQEFCGGACVDTQTNSSHCGGCGTSCTGGRSCVTGSCQCPNGGTWCDGACVDTQTEGNHCGSCGNVCEGGSVCGGGTCNCPAGQIACNNSCFDPDTSIDHCGGCDQACFAGEVCSGGRCQGPVGADGCGTFARDLTVTEIAVYQSVKIPIMESQQAVSPNARVADVVGGRETMFRVFVDVASGWNARELSARVTLTNGAEEDQYFAKKTISADSTEGQTSNTFQIFVPPEKVLPDTRYSVEVVECGDASGSVNTPRFPASGDEVLGVRSTGVLKINILPVLSNGRLPDTSESALAVYRDYLTAMFPATEVQLTVGSQLNHGFPINWSSLLDQVRSRRISENPPADVYYYGFVKPTDTFGQYCGGGCTAGIGYVLTNPNSSTSRASAGVAYASQSSARTMAHELGHNHGRNHAPSPCSSTISGVDQQYPYPTGSIGVWGYDHRTQVLRDPSPSTDIMGYCSNKWISDYTYRALTDRVASVNASSLQIGNLPRAAWRVVLLDSLGPRWGIPHPRPVEAYGTPLQAEILGFDGSVLATTTVYRTEVADGGGAMLLAPEPEAGWAALQIVGWPSLDFAEPVSVPNP